MTPLRTIHLAGFPLWIYPSPLPVPDHPWVAFEDLAAIAEMDDTDRDTCLAKMRREVPDLVHTAPDGLTLIAEPMVGGLLWDGC